MSEPRITFLDYDARKDPKTDRFCIKCQKDIKPGRRVRRVWLKGGGESWVVHPDDRHLIPPEDLDEWLLGMDCAKILGMEWSSEVQVEEGGA